MTEYRGRFAPTPSGPLHFGSLFAAVVSYLDAKAHRGQWLVRIEDLDPPREAPGASDRILNSLEHHGLLWDESVTYQSNNSQRYLERLDQLQTAGRLFWCSCSRKQLTGESIYPGTCRAQKTPMPNCAVRLRIKCADNHFKDVFQGWQSADVSKQYGDVILRRKDQLFAYQLAVVADDIAQNISHIIRGMDLLDSTYWQQELYGAFIGSSPEFGHFPVLHSVGSTQKLSKQNHAPAIENSAAQQNLITVFNLLGMTIDTDNPSKMLKQAVAQWHRNALVGKQVLQVPLFELD